MTHVDVDDCERRVAAAPARRCFVIDAVCAMEFGHSLNSLNYFSQLARARWPQVESVASYHLPRAKGASDGIDRFFDFYYDKFITIDRLELYRNGFNLAAPGDPLRRALIDFSDFFFYKGIGPSDSLVLPNADIYSLIAILTLLDGMPIASTPKLFLRFIGVMEHARYFERDAFDVVARKLSDLKKRGLTISISAETPTLSRSLAIRLDTNVSTTPYPLTDQPILPLPSDKFIVLCGGSARADKGFARLPGIVDRIVENTKGSIEFVIQNAPPAEQMSHQETVRALSKMRNVTLLDGILPFSEIIEAYAKTTISMMPYDPSVYAERGSAVLMESIMLGRLVVGQTDTAFAEQIMLYNSGEVARSDDDFVRAVIRLSTIPRQYLWEQALSSRQRYLDDIEKSYAKWFGDA